MSVAKPIQPFTSDDDLSLVVRMLHRDYEQHQRLKTTPELYRDLESLQFQRADYRERIKCDPESVSFPQEMLAYLDGLIADTEMVTAERECLMRQDAELARYRVPTQRQRTSLPTDVRDLKRLWPIRDFAERMMCVDFAPGSKPRGRCPLPDHREKTPSFTVYPESDSWYCFGCRRGGDIFTLAALYFGLHPVHEFREVVRRVADATPDLLGGAK